MGRDNRCEEKSGQAWPNEAQGRGGVGKEGRGAMETWKWPMGREN